jgi:hypothetical protein
MAFLDEPLTQAGEPIDEDHPNATQADLRRAVPMAYYALFPLRIAAGILETLRAVTRARQEFQSWALIREPMNTVCPC